jgi:biotin operon repressor
MNIELMKTIILNLSEWMNTPNDELEDMMGISWSQFWDLIQEIREQ